MKKWYDEEYKFEIEGLGFFVVITQNDIAETERKLEINIPVHMDVQQIRMDKVSVPRS